MATSRISCPPDASRSALRSFKHYQAQSDEWNQRVTIAGKEGRAEDILTLAGDVPSPYYRRKLLRQCGEALLALGRFAQAEKVLPRVVPGCSEGMSPRTSCASNRNSHSSPTGSDGEAKRSKNSATWPSRCAGRTREAHGVLGRVYKDMWRTTWSQAAKLED